MMKILILSWEYPPYVVGGLGRHVAELVPALAQEAVEVHIVTPTAKEPETTRVVEDGVVVHRVSTATVEPKTNIYEQALAVNERLKDYLNRLDEDFDLIHDHDWLTSFAAISAQRTWGRPLVTTIHATERGRSRGHINNDLQRSIDNAERYLIQEADHIIVCSKHMASEVQYFFQTQPDNVDVIPNGVDVAQLRNGYSQEELTAFRAKFAEPDEQIVFTIARLVYEKGIHLLIEAIPQILDECPQARIIVAGKGPEADNLKQQAHRLGVADRVRFIGFISDQKRNCLFKVADCAVFPSLYEPFGIVALEAMALRCPLVVSDIGGLAEVVKHAETGIKIYPNNVDSTAWGIVHALAHPDWTKKHTIKAYQAVIEEFNWTRIAKLTKAVYNRIVEQEPAVPTIEEAT